MRKQAFNMTILMAVYFLFFAMFVLAGCQKNIRNEPENELMPATASSNKTTATAQHIPAAVALDWYKLQASIFILANPATNNVLNSESISYIGIGLYEAVRSGIKNSKSLSASLYQMPEMPTKDNNGYDLVVSANAAVSDLMRLMYTGLTPANLARVDSLENAWYTNSGLDQQSTKFKRSKEYGKAVAASISTWAHTDQFNISNAGYVVPLSPAGVWVPTPPAFTPIPTVPFISSSRPLLAADATGIVPPIGVNYSEIPGSDFYNMVREVYNASQSLTTEQRNMALYWNDVGVGVGYTPIGHIINVITQAVEQNNVDLGTAAQAYAKAGIATREAILLTFRSKYVYNLIRPVSYIRKLWDPTWNSLIPTPVHPEYPSAHAFITSATMRAAASVLGQVSVTDHSYDFRGFAPRYFAKLDDAGTESGNSRFYGGIHYKPSIAAGLTAGRELGDRIGTVPLYE